MSEKTQFFNSLHEWPDCLDVERRLPLQEGEGDTVMLKITIHPETGATRLTLEGRLAGPWVEELDRCWRGAADEQQNHVVVDLTGVTFIDPEGKELLTRMWRQGAKLQAVGCLTRCIVEDITKAERTGSSCSSRKDQSKGS